MPVDGIPPDKSREENSEEKKFFTNNQLDFSGWVTFYPLFQLYMKKNGAEDPADHRYSYAGCSCKRKKFYCRQKPG